MKRRTLKKGLLSNVLMVIRYIDNLGVGLAKVTIMINIMKRTNPSIRKAARRKKRLRNMVREAKRVPCMDCGQSFPAVCMDFDHIRDDKEFNVSNSRYDFKRVIAEMNKCEIVCSNCHRIRTAKRLLSASVIDNISGFDPEDSTFES